MLLICGACGYTGALVARAAGEAGNEPILAGRRAEPLDDQTTALDLDRRAFSLGHSSAVGSRTSQQ